MGAFFATIFAALSFSAAGASAAIVDVDNLLVGDVSQGAGGFIALSVESAKLQRQSAIAQTWTVERFGLLAQIDLVGSGFGRRSVDGENFFFDEDFLVTLTVLGGGSVLEPGEIILGAVSKTASEIVDYGITSFDFSSIQILAQPGEVLTWRMSVEDCPEITYCF